MDKNLEGKVVIITGGASGIGRASVLRFLESGAQVVAADINENSGAETLEIAQQAGYKNQVKFYRCDVTQEAQIEALIAFALSKFGRLDCMFNNAGLIGAIGSLPKLEAAAWDQTFAVMVRGVFLGMKHAAQAMISQNSGGTIINTASIAGLSAGAGTMAYSACKAAVISMTRSAAVELAAHRIRVNAICPGLTLTPLVHRGNEEKMEETFSQAQPWPEATKPEGIADVALFLASEQSRFMTGEHIVVDGGLTALGPGLYTGDSAAGNAIVRRIVESRRLSRAIQKEGEVLAAFDSGNAGQ